MTEEEERRMKFQAEVFYFLFGMLMFSIFIENLMKSVFMILKCIFNDFQLVQ